MLAKGIFIHFLCVLTAAVALALPCVAQLDSVYVEVYYEDDGTVPGYPCGYTTFRMYAALSSEEYALRSIYTLQTTDLSVDCGIQGIWNTSWGALLGQDVNPAFWGIHPEAEYDSFITVLKAFEGDEGPAVILNSSPEELETFNDCFNIGGSPELDETGTYVHHGDELFLDFSAGVVDAGADSETASNDGPALIMQVTTNQTFNWRVNVTTVGPGETFEVTWYEHTMVTPEEQSYGDVYGLVGSITPTNICASGCGLVSDFNLNGIVDVPDVLQVLGDMGCVAECTSDLDADAVVATSDLLLVLAKLWNVCGD